MPFLGKSRRIASCALFLRARNKRLDPGAGAVDGSRGLTVETEALS
jgi:hypothetical protein